jgi:hypothetical protein
VGCAENSITYTCTHPLLFPLSARTKRGNLFCTVNKKPPLYEVERACPASAGGYGGEYM